MSGQTRTNADMSASVQADGHGHPPVRGVRCPPLAKDLLRVRSDNPDRSDGGRMGLLQLRLRHWGGGSA